LLCRTTPLRVAVVKEAEEQVSVPVELVQEGTPVLAAAV
jgi:hypothetical protein